MGEGSLVYHPKHREEDQPATERAGKTNRRGQRVFNQGSTQLMANALQQRKGARREGAVCYRRINSAGKQG